MYEDVLVNFLNELHKFEHCRGGVSVAYGGNVNGMPLGNYIIITVRTQTMPYN